MLTEGYQVFQQQHKENGVEEPAVAVTELSNYLQGQSELKSGKRTGHLKVTFTVKLPVINQT
jgi:hypothetical protein